MLLALEQRQVCTQARKATHGLDGQLIKTWTGLPVEESIRVTEDRDEWRKYVHGVADRRIEDGYGTQQNNVTDTAFTERGAGSMKRASVRPAVCLSRRAAGLLLSTVRALPLLPDRHSITYSLRERSHKTLLKKSTHHGLRGSASPVLTATGFVNGRWQFSIPHRIHTP